jgi:hypothetical protein
VRRLALLALCLSSGVASAQRTDATPGADLLFFTADGAASSPKLLPGFLHHSIWSGMGVASDGNVYVAVSNHTQPGGDVAFFRWLPVEARMELLGTARGVSTAAGNWMAQESQYKVHTFLLEHADGLVYMATMDHAPTPFLRGAHVYTIDPATGTVTDASQGAPFLMTAALAQIPNPGLAQTKSGVFVETYGLKGLGLNPRAPDLLYGMTYPDGHLIQQRLSTGAMQVVGQSSTVAYAFHVSSAGDVYYGQPGPEASMKLVKYDESAGTTTTLATIPGELLGAIAPTQDGEVAYVLEAVTKRVYRLDCRADTLTYLATACGTNWWRLFNLSLSPDGRWLWFVSNNNARSTVRRIDVVTGACSEVLDVNALLGTRNLCFGGVNVWDRAGNLYVPVWTFNAAPDLALLRIGAGEAPLSGSPAYVSTRTGGTHTLQLQAGPDQAGQPYVVYGSQSGTAPGTPLSVFTVPLNEDRYFRRTGRPGRTPLQGGFGTLTALGRATALLAVKPAPVLAAVGLTLHHAVVVFDATTGAPRFVSNAVAVELGP